MAIEGLTIIGESINDSVPSTHKLFEAGDLDGIVELAQVQDQRGAGYLDVNVGTRDPEFMAELVRRIQRVTTKPLSIDSPDYELAKAGLEAYDQERAGGAKPILNSISPLRTEMFDLLKIQPFRPILLISEREVDGQGESCHTAEQTYEAAQALCALAKSPEVGLVNDDLILDPGIAPIGTDSEGNFQRLIGAMKLIHGDANFAGVHASVGLSNFTVMLPAKRADGTRVKGPLESAFLTKAMPLGLDMVIGSVKRQYQLLPADDDAMVCLEDCLQADGFDVLMRVRDFYA